VVAIIPRFPPASAPFLGRKLAILRDRGVPISIAATATAPGASLGVPVVDFGQARRAALARHPLACLSLVAAGFRRFGVRRRGLRAAYYAWVFVGLEADVVHFEFSELAVSRADSLELLPALPVIMSCRGSGERVMPVVLPARRDGLQRVLARANLVHCVSAEMVEVVTALGAPPDRIFLNRPAVDSDFYSRVGPSPDGDEARLVMVGRLDWKKGHDLALIAVRRLVDEGVRLHLDVIGEGIEREKLTYMIAALGLGDIVQLRGHLEASEVKAALEDATLFVLPSLSEGISNAALEAMAMEVPVLASAVGGMGEAIEHGVTGFLVDPMDPGALAVAIRDALAHPDLEAITRRARKHVVEDFSIERQADAFEAAYRRVGP
jgi:glycosyltransferase involved in cell wall biosynthesis